MPLLVFSPTINFFAFVLFKIQQALKKTIDILNGSYRPVAQALPPFKQGL